MSEEQPPGSPERPEGQPPGSNPQGPKPFWRRTPFLMAAPPLTLIAIITIVGCVSTSSSTPAASYPGNAAAACRALGAWENGPATDTLTHDPARQKIANLGHGTQFGVDFAKWMHDGDVDNIAQSMTDATLVSQDCQAAGVPGILSASSGSASASAAPPSPSGSASGSPSPSAAPGPTMSRQTDTVVFKVTGSGYPSIQYGTDSNNDSPPGGYGPLGNGNALPWSASLTYDSSALYYYVSAQLQGYGDISDSVTEVITTYCSDGSHETESFALANGHASGGYNIAQAEYTGGNTGNATQAESDAGC